MDPTGGELRVEKIVVWVSIALTLVMMATYGIEPTWAILWMPVVIAVTIVFAMAISFPASLFGLWFRELRPLAISFVRALFFLGAGLVPLAASGAGADNTLRLNPLTGLFELYRSVLMFGETPPLWEFAYPLALSAVLLAMFVPVYRSEQRQFAKVVE